MNNRNLFFKGLEARKSKISVSGDLVSDQSLLPCSQMTMTDYDYDYDMAEGTEQLASVL